MMARRHMHEFGTTREQMAAVAVKNHKNGALNPEAQFQKEITIDAVLQAPWVAEPLGLFDCAPLSDGAAAVVLCEAQRARKFSDTPIRIAGSGQASDFLALHDRRDLTTLDATVIAGKRAFHEAKMMPKDVQVAEVHDNFTISEILAIEDLRFIERSEEHTSELQSHHDLVCRLLLEKKKKKYKIYKKLKENEIIEDITHDKAKL